MSFSSNPSSPSPTRDSSDRSSSVSGRNRTRRACTSCRLHKTKCNGSKPCVNCMKKGWLCSYDKKPRHFGKLLLTPTYLMQLEDDNRRLSQAVQAMHKKLVEHDAWDLDEIQHDEAGEPVVHSIVEALGISDPVVKPSTEGRSDSLGSAYSDAPLSPLSLARDLTHETYKPAYLPQAVSEELSQQISAPFFSEPDTYQNSVGDVYLGGYNYLHLANMTQRHIQNLSMDMGSGTATPAEDMNGAYEAFIQPDFNGSVSSGAFQPSYDEMFPTTNMSQDPVGPSMSWPDSLTLMATLQQQVAATLATNGHDVQSNPKWLTT